MTAAPKSSLFRKTLHTLATLLITQGSTIAAGIATARAFGPSGKGVLALAFILVVQAYGYVVTLLLGLPCLYILRSKKAV